MRWIADPRWFVGICALPTTRTSKISQLSPPRCAGQGGSVEIAARSQIHRSKFPREVHWIQKNVVYFCFIFSMYFLVQCLFVFLCFFLDIININFNVFWTRNICPSFIVGQNRFVTKNLHFHCLFFLLSNLFAAKQGRNLAKLFFSLEYIWKHPVHSHN
jgi:hypothetical protein